MLKKAMKFGSFSMSAVLIFSIIFIFSSCTQTKKSVYELLSENEDDQSLLMIVDNPKEDVISKVEIKKSLTFGDNGERMLLIPKYANSVLEIWSIANSNGSYVPVEKLYSNALTEENFVLDLSAVRSDTAPQYKIIIRTAADYAEYILFGENDNEEKTEYVESDLGTLKKTDIFTVNEIGYTFSQGAEYLSKAYGSPTDTKTVESASGTVTQMYFGKSEFEINNLNGLIVHAVLYDDVVAHPRNIKIGDSLPVLLSRFPNKSDGTVTEVFGENENYAGKRYQKLYGDNTDEGNYGYILYDNKDMVIKVVYSNAGNQLVFSIENNRVTSVEYKKK